MEPAVQRLNLYFVLLTVAVFASTSRAANCYPSNESESSTRVGYLDRKGKFLIPPTLHWACQFSDGVAWVQTLADSKATPPRFCAINHSGHHLFSTILKVDEFHCGLARVHQDRLFGFINKAGTIVIPTVYSSAENFEDNLSRVSTSDYTWSMIDTAGALVTLNPRRHKVGSGEFIHTSGNAVVDETGRVRFKPIEGTTDHERRGHYSEGLCHVTLLGSNFEEHHEAFMNKSGEIVLTLPAEIKVCSDFHDGRASIVMEHQDDNFHQPGQCVGFIDQTGAVVIPAIYELPESGHPYIPVELIAFHDGIVHVRKMGIDYYLDKTGNPIAQFQGGFCSDFLEGLALVEVRVDAQGKMIDFSDIRHGYQNRFDYESLVCKKLSEALRNVRLGKPVIIRFHEGAAAAAPNITADSVPVAMLSEIRALVNSVELPRQGVFMEKFIYFDVILLNGSVTCDTFHSHYHE